MVAKLSLAMIPTQLPGVTMYRFSNFTKYMKRDFNLFQPPLNMAGQNNQAWEYFVKEESVATTLFKVINSADMIIFQRFNNPKNTAIIQAIREAERVHQVKERKLIGFEIDDYMFNVPDGNMAKSTFNAGGDFFNAGLKQLQLSDFVVTSTNYLREKYKQYNKNIFVVENHIDMEWWGKIVPHVEKGKKIRIGWAGANGHSEDLEMFKPVVDAILAKYGDKVEFYFYSPIIPFTSKEGLEIEKGYVPLPEFPKKLKSLNFDIGVVPLRDNDFNRSKSNIRYLEMGLTGIPVVASNLGQFTESIKHGIDGYLASTVDNFIEHLSYLIEHADVRASVGALAQNKIKTEFNAKNGAKKYTEMVKQARRVCNGFPNLRKQNSNTASAIPG